MIPSCEAIEASISRRVRYSLDERKDRPAATRLLNS
jgi:hypothetical protein